MPQAPAVAGRSADSGPLLGTPQPLVAPSERERLQTHLAALKVELAGARDAARIAQTAGYHQGGDAETHREHVADVEAEIARVEGLLKKGTKR